MERSRMPFRPSNQSLIAIIIIFTGIFRIEISQAEGGSIPWKQLCDEDSEVGQLIISGCKSEGCVVRLDEPYYAKFVITPNRNHEHEYLGIKVSARNIYGNRSWGLLWKTLPKRLEAGKTFSLAKLPLIFRSNQFADNTLLEPQMQEVRVWVLSWTGRIEVCRGFNVYLDSTVPNNGTKHGDSCSVINRPCNFTDTVCMKENNEPVCKCNAKYAVEDNKLCRMKIDSPCIQQSECLRNGDCVNGTCQCQKYYAASSAQDQCTETVNIGRKIGDNCTLLSQPCMFVNSVCVENICECSLNFVENDGNCKKAFGVACSKSDECLDNGECSNGLCQCLEGYEANPDKVKCSPDNGAAAITISVLLLAVGQMLLFVH